MRNPNASSTMSNRRHATSSASIPIETRGFIDTSASAYYTDKLTIYADMPGEILVSNNVRYADASHIANAQTVGSESETMPQKLVVQLTEACDASLPTHWRSASPSSARTSPSATETAKRPSLIDDKNAWAVTCAERQSMHCPSIRVSSPNHRGASGPQLLRRESKTRRFANGAHPRSSTLGHRKPITYRL